MFMKFYCYFTLLLYHCEPNFEFSPSRILTSKIAVRIGRYYNCTFWHTCTPYHTIQGLFKLNVLWFSIKANHGTNLFSISLTSGCVEMAHSLHFNFKKPMNQSSNQVENHFSRSWGYLSQLSYIYIVAI